MNLQSLLGVRRVVLVLFLVASSAVVVCMVLLVDRMKVIYECERLSSENWEDVILAAKFLKGRGSDLSVPYLKQALNNKYVDARSCVIDALLEFGSESRCYVENHLIGELGDKNFTVRADAVRELLRIGGVYKVQTSVLINMVRSVYEFEAAAAQAALISVGDVAVAAVVDAALKSDARVREMFVAVLRERKVATVSIIASKLLGEDLASERRKLLLLRQAIEDVGGSPR